ncbi:MAG: hypothetical protein AAF488_03305 [Planctomycetota bacterium]
MLGFCPKPQRRVISSEEHLEVALNSFTRITAIAATLQVGAGQTRCFGGTSDLKAGEAGFPSWHAKA